MKLRAWLYENVYLSPLSRESRKAEDVVVALFEHYLHRSEERTKTDSDPITETVDFVAGMTDRYALATYKRLFLPRSDTIFK
jgi:dGTPase